MKKSSLRSIIAMTCLAAAATAHADTYEFNIRNAVLSDALKEFASQSGLQVVYFAKIAANQSATPVSGAFSAEDALDKLLAPSNLTYERIDAKTIAIRARGTHRPPATNVRAAGEFQKTSLISNEAGDVRLAEATNDGQGQSTVGAVATANDSDNEKSRRIQLEEVIVTGSHIRGAQNLSSPMITFDRKEIEAGGYATTQQLIESLPQSLNNISDLNDAQLSGGPGWGTSYAGAGANLRGLGGDATLVLLNGRRLAAAGNGSFVDLSLIPLGAIERVEVLTDGASALYGSDAIGGVMNLVLRKDFDGAETRVRYGSVTEGSHSELLGGQMLGHSWGSGQALFSYEYLRRTGLNATDRKFFEPNEYYDNIRLVPSQKRHGVIGVFDQRLTDRVGLSGELLYGQRASASSFVSSTFPADILIDVKQYGASLGLSVDIARDWQMRMTGVFSQNDSELEDIRQSFSGRQTTFVGNESRLSSLDLITDGSVASTSGGDVRLALGGQVRRETFVEEFAEYPAELERDVAAVYGELLVPLIGTKNRRRGAEQLELTLAARYEDYSDFGSTFNPKFGLAWMPVQGLNLRGTWGTSFKAPLLTQLNPANSSAFIFEGYYVDVSGTPPVLNLVGNGVALGPEESKNWTAGIDISPQALPDLSVSLTYFDIDYDDRVSSPFTEGYDTAGALLDPTYAALVTRNPDLQSVQRLVSGARRTAMCFDYTTLEFCDMAERMGSVEAVLDGRMRNLAGVRTNGIDFLMRYRIASTLGDWGLSFSGSQLLSNRQQLVPSAPETSELNQVYRPVDFRFRNSVSFSRNDLNVMAAVNYADGYRDTRMLHLAEGVQRPRVGSWTTIDLTLQYDFSWLGEMSVQFAAVNLFDRNPPYVGSDTGLHYDGVNANARGRFISAQVTARW